MVFNRRALRQLDHRRCMVEDHAPTGKDEMVMRSEERKSDKNIGVQSPEVRQYELVPALALLFARLAEGFAGSS